LVEGVEEAEMRELRAVLKDSEVVDGMDLFMDVVLLTRGTPYRRASFPDIIPSQNVELYDTVCSRN